MEATGLIRSLSEEWEGRQEDVVIVDEGIADKLGSGFEEDDCFDGAELLAAAEEGNTDKVSEILAKDANLILVGDSMGDTALHLAARAGHGDTFLKLIEIGDQHSRLEKALMVANEDGDTALHLAIKNGHLHIAKDLVKAQLRVSHMGAWNKDGVSALDLAVQSGCVDIYTSDEEDEEPEAEMEIPYFGVVDVEMGLRRLALEDYSSDEENEVAEAKINMVKWLKFRNAARKGLEDVVQQMLEQDPELVRYVDYNQGPALHVVLGTGQVGSLRKLVQFITTNSRLTKAMLKTNRLGDTALHTALKYELFTAAGYLIKAEPKAVYQVNKHGVSPLVMVVEKGHEDLLRCMIRHTSLSSSSSVKQSMLYHAKEISLPHTAIKSKNLGTLRAMMEELPGLINLTNDRGWKPLSYAASKGYLDQVIYLLKTFPESAKKCDKDGSFPIHKVVAGGHLDILKEFLLYFPEMLSAIDKKGRSILHIAARYAKGEVLAYLKKDKDIEKIFSVRDNAGDTFMDMEEKTNKGPVSGSM